MADLLIRGVEMPIDCHSCWMCVYCYERGMGIWGCGKGKPCPLLPLPEGHGRLGDLDALAAQFRQQIVNEDDLMELCKRAGLMSNYFDESKVQIGMVTFLRMLARCKNHRASGRRRKGMLNKIIKMLLRIKLRHEPAWFGSSFAMDYNTDVHVLVERWYTFGAKSFHCYGTKVEEIGGGEDCN